MVRPGVNVRSRATAPARGVPSDTGTLFLGGQAAKGPSDRAVLVRNMAEFEKIFGARVSYGLLWDALDVAFHTGITRAYVGRTVGPAATTATVAFPGAAAALAISVDAIGPGTSTLSVAIVAGDAAGTVRIRVFDTAVSAVVAVEESYDLADVAAAVAWGSQSEFVRVRATGAVLPLVAASTAVAGGADDRASITDAHRTTTLGLFTKALGPGQVSYPGATTLALQTALLTHAQANNRFALLDGPDTASNATLQAAADAIRTSLGATNELLEFGALFAPWPTVPGVVRNTTRTTPPVATVAGLVAARDAVAGTNAPAAGDDGESAYALGLAQAEFSDAIRQTLNEHGVNLFRSIYGAIRLYGYRTLAGPESGFIAMSHARTRMAISSRADILGEKFMFEQLDGKGLKVAEFGAALSGMLAEFYNQGALYGASPAEAFSVDVGASVNTPATLGANELRAVLTVRLSPFAEAVTIEIVKVPITTSL